MLICDTHADTLWVRCRCPAGAACDITLEAMTEYPEETRLQVLALFVSTGGMEQKPTVVERELAMLETLKKESFRQVTRVEDALPGQANVMLSIEGGEAFEGKIENVERFARMGVRLGALMWNNENGIGHPAMGGSGEGLTPYGKSLVKEMNRCKMAVDISHLNEKGSFEVMEGETPALASHSCAKALCDHPRNLSEEQLRLLFQTKGFVGVNFYSDFLSTNGIADLNTVVDHMAYMCDLGGEDCVGFGSDFDGIDAYPEGLRTAHDVPALLENMRRRGFGDELVKKIAGENFRRYMAAIGTFC